MVQHQHIAYAQNHNCGARYLQFTLLLIAVYIIADCNLLLNVQSRNGY